MNKMLEERFLTKSAGWQVSGSSSPPQRGEASQDAQDNSAN
jgi:hypothetical protein